MAKSIIQTDKVCLVCGSVNALEKHHCIFGTANRKKADEDGLWVWLCHYHHQSVHNENARLKNVLQIRAEQEWIKKNGSEEDFIKRFGRSYLNGTVG